MIGGAQPKVLLTQDEDGNLHLDKRFEEVFGTEYMNYKLVREGDGLTKQSQDVMWIEFDENGNPLIAEEPITTTEYEELTVCAAILTACDPLRQEHCIHNPDWIDPATVVEEVPVEEAPAEGEEVPAARRL